VPHAGEEVFHSRNSWVPIVVRIHEACQAGLTSLIRIIGTIHTNPGKEREEFLASCC
jgi:hypothetical protein